MSQFKLESVHELSPGALSELRRECGKRGIELVLERIVLGDGVKVGRLVVELRFTADTVYILQYMSSDTHH